MISHNSHMPMSAVAYRSSKYAGSNKVAGSHTEIERTRSRTGWRTDSSCILRQRCICSVNSLLNCSFYVMGEVRRVAITCPLHVIGEVRHLMKIFILMQFLWCYCIVHAC